MKSNARAEKKSEKDAPGPASKPYSLAPLSTPDALRTLLNAKPETLAKLKDSEKKTGKPSGKKG